MAMLVITRWYQPLQIKRTYQTQNGRDCDVVAVRGNLRACSTLW